MRNEQSGHDDCVNRHGKSKARSFERIPHERFIPIGRLEGPFASFCTRQTFWGPNITGRLGASKFTLYFRAILRRLAIPNVPLKTKACDQLPLQYWAEEDSTPSFRAMFVPTSSRFPSAPSRSS